MSALVRRHRLWVTVFACALLVGVGWAWVTHMMAADSAPAVAAAQAASKSDAVKSELSRSHSVAADLNANTRSVAEARKSGKNPERLSAMFMPEAFDKAKFEANPQAYLDVVEPARVYQTAEPGMKVVQLQAKDYYVVPMVAGGSVDLVVVGTPKAPVTFTAFDGGVFQNQLNSVTVRSDEKGEARATFMATRGTIENVRVVAGSPLASDQVHFDVKVSLARAKDDAAKDAAK